MITYQDRLIGQAEVGGILWLATQRMLATRWISNSPGAGSHPRPSLWARRPASLAWDYRWKSACGPKMRHQTRCPRKLGFRYGGIVALSALMARGGSLTFAITSERGSGGLLQRFLATKDSGYNG